MGFADSLLSTGERITHREKQHWFVFVWGARFTILALIVGIILGAVSLSQGQGPLRDVLSWIVAVIFVGGLAVLLWTLLHYLNQEYVITNRRVMQVGRRAQQDARPTARSRRSTTRASSSRSSAGCFGFGDLDDPDRRRESAIEKFQMIEDPIGFKKAMLDEKHEFEVDMEGQSSAAGAPRAGLRRNDRRRSPTARRRPRPFGRAAPAPAAPADAGRRPSRAT